MKNIFSKFILAAAVTGLGIAAAATGGNPVNPADAAIIKKITHLQTGANDRPATDIILKKLEIFRSESTPTS